MKRLSLVSFFAGCLFMAGLVHAQSASTTAAPAITPASGAVPAGVTGVATSDTSQLRQYVGNYTVATGDVKQIIVTVERGRLVGEAVGLGQSALIPASDTPDAFTVPDPNGGSDVYGSVQFGRDPAGRVRKVVLIVQGQTFEGIRTN